MPRLLSVICAALLVCIPIAAQAQQARISKLTDVAFGTITNFTTDIRSAQSICVYSTGTSSRYRVTATGNGSGGAFTLASGGNTLAYMVEWNSSAGQTSGTALTSGVALTGQISSATASRCQSGPVSSASLITILPTANVSSARVGTYSGALTLLIAPN